MPCAMNVATFFCNLVLYSTLNINALWCTVQCKDKICKYIMLNNPLRDTSITIKSGIADFLQYQPTITESERVLNFFLECRECRY